MSQNLLVMLWAWVFAVKSFPEPAVNTRRLQQEAINREQDLVYTMTLLVQDINTLSKPVPS